jgi:hypothetical protein
VAKEVAAGKQVKAASNGPSLLDLQEDISTPSGGVDPREKEELGRAISDASDRLDRLSKIRRERDEVLKDLKEKVSCMEYILVHRLSMS